MSNCLTGSSSARRTDALVWEWKSISPEIVAITNILPQLKDENRIGRGGSQEMYKIKANPPGIFVVVKKIPKLRNLDRTPQKIEEIEILKKSRHQNITEMIGCFRSSTSTFILYPYFKKGILHGFLRPNQAPHEVLSWPRRIRIAWGLAQGLHYMHHGCSPAVLHGNVKSSNILLDDHFNPKIVGFRSAKFAERGCANTTLANKQVDVYKFGVILLELLIIEDESRREEQQLVKWAHAYADDLGNKQITIDVLDKAIREQRYRNDIDIVFKRAICCTDKPSKRSDMEKVLDSLRRCTIDFP